MLGYSNIKNRTFSDAQYTLYKRKTQQNGEKREKTLQETPAEKMQKRPAAKMEGRSLVVFELLVG